MKIKLLFLLLLPTNVFALFDSYNTYIAYQAGNLENAEQQYASLAANNLDDWQPLYNLGTIALNKQKFEDAVIHLEKALTLDPENKTIQERLAIAKKLRDEQKKQQQEQQNEQNKKDQSSKQESEQKSKEEREQKNQQSDQQKTTQPNEQQGQPNRKEQEKDQAHNAHNKQEGKDAHKQPESSSQQGQQEREKENAKNNTDSQRQDPMHGTSQQKQPQDSAKKIAHAQALANDTRFSEEERKFMEQLDKLDKQGQQQMLAIALAPSQAEQQFEDHNW